jgi:4a-hydroxytetrahydrobiopterin dehydratase
MENPVRLKRQEISEAVSGLGWRLILGELQTQVPAESLTQAAEIAARVAAGVNAGSHLRIDGRADGLHLSLTTPAVSFVTAEDLDLARSISAIVASSGLRTESGNGADRSVQRVEIGIDALDIPAIRPFWKAVLGYGDEPGRDGPDDAIVDPAGQGPAIWFQQMDAPRPQRNRIHLDINVPHDEAQRRIDDTIAAGGKLTYTAEAPAFWVLADPEGNEACICTWQARDLFSADSSWPGRGGTGRSPSAA